MTYFATHWAKHLQIILLSALLCSTTACSAYGDDVKASFLWGPVSQSLNDSSLTAPPAYAEQSHAAQLREELLAPVNRYAPGDKDWRYVRGSDKGPTIFGARLAIGLGEQGHTQLRLGAVRRGANRTYGPQLILNFGN